jgi:tetratricopeptide (TPR) repeat protein
MENLEGLVQTLNSSEQAYFSRYSFSGKKEGTILAKMFQLMRNGKSDEFILRKLFGKNENGSRVHKNKLQNALLDSLSSYNGDSNPDNKVFSFIQRGIVLRNKGLVNFASKYFEKAAVFSEAAERYDLAECSYYNLLNLSKKNSADAEWLEKRKNWLEKMRSCLRTQENILKYSEAFDEISVIQSEVSNFKYSQQAQIKKLKKILEQKIFEDEKNAFSFEAKCLFYLCHSRFALASGDKLRAHIFNRQLLQTMEKHPEKMPWYDSKFRYSLNQYLNSCIDLSDFSDFDHFLTVLEDSGKGLGTVNKARQWLMIVNLKLNRNFKEENISENISVIQEIEKELSSYEKVLEQSFFSALYANCAISFFHEKQFKSALKYINKLLNNFPEKGNTALLTMMRLLNLAVHHELKNEKLLNYLLKNYFAKETGEPFAVLQNVCVQFVSALSGNKKKDGMTREDFILHLNDMKKDNSIKAVLEDCYFDRWAKQLSV